MLGGALFHKFGAAWSEAREASNPQKLHHQNSLPELTIQVLTVLRVLSPSLQRFAEAHRGLHTKEARSPGFRLTGIGGLYPSLVHNYYGLGPF